MGLSASCEGRNMIATQVRIICLAALVSIGCWGQTSDSAQQQKSNQPPRVQKDLVAAEKSQQPKSHLHLTIVETIPAKRVVASGFADLNCDEDGNIFLGAESWAGGIRKLNSKGELLADVEPYANPDVEVYGVGSYTLTYDGEL